MIVVESLCLKKNDIIRMERVEWEGEEFRCRDISEEVNLVFCRRYSKELNIRVFRGNGKKGRWEFKCRSKINRICFSIGY